MQVRSQKALMRVIRRVIIWVINKVIGRVITVQRASANIVEAGCRVEETGFRAYAIWLSILLRNPENPRSWLSFSREPACRGKGFGCVRLEVGGFQQ